MVEEVKAVPFEDGERVLVPQNNLLYEARVLKSRRNAKKGDRWECFIHYQGWNKKWDEWMPVTSLRKYVEGASTTGRGAVKGGKETEEEAKPAAKKSKKRKKADDKGPEPGPEPEPDYGPVKLTIPGPLKHHLITDWDSVTRDLKVVSLPRVPNVEALLDQYVESKASRTPSVEELVSGLKTYFNRSLEAILLYTQEQPAVKEALAGGLPPSAVFGAEHFLRLFVKLPELLPYTNLEGNSLTLLRARLEDVLGFMVKNQAAFFNAEWVANPYPVSPGGGGGTSNGRTKYVPPKKGKGPAEPEGPRGEPATEGEPAKAVSPPPPAVPTEPAEPTEPAVGKEEGATEGGAGGAAPE